MNPPTVRASHLTIVADDWGYSRRYDEGILVAARAGAIDAVSAMVLRPSLDPQPLLESGVEIGLHFELSEPAGQDLLEAPRRQANAFEAAFGRPPAHIDGHHHQHATPAICAAIEALALELDVSVRAVGEGHRRRLRRRGIATADRLVGRMGEGEATMPPLIAAALEQGSLPSGTTEWVVHPGYADPGAGSSYDRGREQDLALLLELAGERALTAGRATHRAALVAG